MFSHGNANQQQDTRQAMTHAKRKNYKRYKSLYTYDSKLYTLIIKKPK